MELPFSESWECHFFSSGDEEIFSKKRIFFFIGCAWLAELHLALEVTHFLRFDSPCSKQQKGVVTPSLRMAPHWLLFSLTNFSNFIAFCFSEKV